MKGINAHTFNVDLACDLGLQEAILLQHFWYWHERNLFKDKYKRDGHIWTYNSVRTLRGIFPYLTKDRITGTLKRLINGGYIIENNFNEIGFDQTKWYSLTDKSLEYFKPPPPISENPKCSSENPNSHFGKSETNTYSNNSNEKIIYEKSKKFIKPNIEELKEYINKNNLQVDPEDFFDSNEQKGWVVGKYQTPMKNWKAALRTWHRQASKTKETQQQGEPEYPNLEEYKYDNEQ